ncbi:MAG: hypothetical protein LBQ19_04495 [Synergistaceae bacterium]|jgi:hypothetical protein|nr:hypothetical protein [Synergistaceae bacterium]
MIFIMPFVLGIVVFAAVFVAIFMLLARLGLLPGVVFRTYKFAPGRDKGREAPRGGFRDETVGNSSNGWYQDVQEGEIITLPETALKKDDK